MKTISFFFFVLFFTFTNSIFAEELSDQEKREFIESLAKPSTEERIFYSWQDGETIKKLLETGEMPPDLQQYYFPEDTTNLSLIHPSRYQSGLGFYAVEDMLQREGGAPSRRNANMLIEVKIEPGTQVLDIADKTVREQLKQKGIRPSDVYYLNPEVVVKDFGLDKEFGVNSDHAVNRGDATRSWVIKTPKGVKFQPFGEAAITTVQQGLDMLDDLHRQMKALVGGGDFIRRRQYLFNRVARKTMSLPFNTLQETTDFINTIAQRQGLLKDGDRYSEAIEKVVNQAKNISPKTAQEGLSFLESLNLDEVDYALSPTERAQIEEKLLPLIGSDETLKNSLEELLAKNAEATNSWRPLESRAVRVSSEPPPPVKKSRLQCLRDQLSKLFTRKQK